MMSVRFAVIHSMAALACAFAMAAHAQTAGDFMTNPAFADPPPARCESTLEMQHCAAHELRAADADMSARYTARRAELDQAGKKALLQEQRTWLKMRDRSCREKARQYAGGSMAGVAVAQCWVTVTQTRARDLAAR